MQRTLFDKDALTKFAVLALLLVYEAVGSIYRFLPPLFGVMFVLYIDAYEKRKLMLQLVIFGYLILFESDRGFLFLSSIIFFVISVEAFVSPLKNVISCKQCLMFIFVFYAYFSYWLFLSFISGLFEADTPAFSNIFFYYALLESILLVFLL